MKVPYRFFEEMVDTLFKVYIYALSLTLTE